MRYFVWLLFVFLLFVIIVFSGLNSSQVVINFYVMKFRVALSFLLLLSMLVGVFLMGIACFSSWLRYQSTLRKLRLSISELNAELDNLRRLPVEDLKP